MFCETVEKGNRAAHIYMIFLLFKFIFTLLLKYSNLEIMANFQTFHFAICLPLLYIPAGEKVNKYHIAKLGAIEKTPAPYKLHCTLILRCFFQNYMFIWHFPWKTVDRGGDFSKVLGQLFKNQNIKQDCIYRAEKAMAPHSSTLAWEIPGTGEPSGLQSMGSRRVGHDWATLLSLFTFMHWRRKWQPTPVFLPGESQGRGSLVCCRLRGRTESDTTEAT